MISIIKTAIITIIISFISGLMLEHYKSLAPRILRNMGKGIPLVMNNKRICAYILTIRNISNKTIHELSLNIQGSQNNLKIGDAKITKGLKFDSSIKDNIVDVSIPFLSKEDEFSVTLYVENQDGVYNKPVVTIRSPESFKEIDSVEQKGVLYLLFNIPKNINKVFSKTMKNDKTINKENREIFHRSKKSRNNKKAMIAIVSIILIISVAGVGGFYFKEMSANTQTTDTKANAQKQSNDSTEPAGEITKNTGEKASTGGKTKNAGAKGSTNGTTKNAGANTLTNGTDENTDTKAPTNGTGEKTDSKTPTNEKSENTDTKTLTNGTDGNTNTPTNGITQNTDAKTSTSGITKNQDTKTLTDGATKNTDTKMPTDGSSDTKTPTGGTTENTAN